MTRHITPTRRMFLKNGALLAAPVAVTSAAARAAAAALADDGPTRDSLAGDSLKARLAHLEDEAAIRELHQSWLRRVNAGEREALLEAPVRRISADQAGLADRIVIAADGRSASGHFDCIVELEAPLPEGPVLTRTLVRMAHAQGSHTVRRVERRTLVAGYARTASGWTVGRVAWSG